MEIKNNHLKLSILPEHGSFELESAQYEKAHIRSGLAVTCRGNGNTLSLLASPWEVQSILQDNKISTPITNLEGVIMTIRTPLPGADVLLKMGLAEDLPMAFIQMTVINHSQLPLSIARLEPLNIQPGHCQITSSKEPDYAFYSNGWQSWSTTGTYGNGEKQRTTRLGRLHVPMVVNPGTPTPRKPGHFSGDMFGVLGDRTSQIGIAVGFLSQKQHFGSLEAKLGFQPSLSMWANGDLAVLNPGEQTQTDWAVLSFVDLSDAEPLKDYLEAVAKTHQIQLENEKIPVGWCSWYHYYQDVKESDIESNLEAILSSQKELPLSLVQIDDGFEVYPGDWFDFDPFFPNGLKSISEKIRAAGLAPGLWLAPFIVHPKAKLVKEHPDWLLKDDRGHPVTAGFVWNHLTYALDLTHPQALDYAVSVIRTAVKEWGFEYLKLDFLYAAAVEGVYQDRTKTRAQVLREGLEALRQAAGAQVRMLACGCPLGSALGLFEAMRIGADVNGYWHPHFPPVSKILRREPNMPSARNAIQNTLTRAMLHRKWWVNDPDCLLLRPDTDLTLAEVQSLATVIGMTGGSILLSDNLTELPKNRISIAKSLLPVIDQPVQVVDWFDEYTPKLLRIDFIGTRGAWHLLAAFNWYDHPATLRLSPALFSLNSDQDWRLREFWTGQIGKMNAHSPFVFTDVPAHGVRVVAAVPFRSEQPAYLGSTLHLSQGMEISEWKDQNNELKISFKLERKAAGKVFLFLPWEPKSAYIKDRSHKISDEGSGIYSVDFENADGETLLINK